VSSPWDGPAGIAGEDDADEQAQQAQQPHGVEGVVIAQSVEVEETVVASMDDIEGLDDAEILGEPDGEITVVSAVERTVVAEIDEDGAVVGIDVVEDTVVEVLDEDGDVVAVDVEETVVETWDAEDLEAEDDPQAAEQGDGATDPIDDLDDGSAITGSMPVADDVPGSDVLFTLSSREQFSALDDPEVTGDARVDAAAARLSELPDLPTSDHVAVYDDVHRRLQDALADADVT
jgi:hypothetical protein